MTDSHRLAELLEHVRELLHDVEREQRDDAIFDLRLEVDGAIEALQRRAN